MERSFERVGPYLISWFIKSRRMIWLKCVLQTSRQLRQRLCVMSCDCVTVHRHAQNTSSSHLGPKRAMASRKHRRNALVISVSRSRRVPTIHQSFARFQNIPSGTPITRGAVTADYSLQLQLGSKNYEQWKKDNCDLSSRVGDAIAAAIGPHRVQIPVLIPSSSTDSGGSINDPGWNESDYGRSSSYFGRGPAYSARSAGGGAGSKYRPR